MMIESKAPAQLHGEATMYAAYILNRLPFRAGEKLSRLEMYKQRTIPGQLDKIHVFCCAAYVHTKHDTGPYVHHFQERSELHVFLGYDEESQCYRLCKPHQPRKVIFSAHVIFVEDDFPFSRAPFNSFPGYIPSASFLPSHSSSTLPDQASVPFQSSGLIHSVSRNTGGKIRIARRPVAEHEPAEEEKHETEGESPPADLAPDPPVRRSERLASKAGTSMYVYDAIGSPDPDDPHDEALDLDFESISFFVDDCVYAVDDKGRLLLLEQLRGPEKREWLRALKSEYDSHVSNGTLGPACKLPDGFKPIPLDIILKVKRDGRKKVRAIIKGFLMHEGLDYNQTFAPVPNLTTFRILLALAAKFDWEIKQGDVHTAFLSAEMDAEVYVRVPSYFTDNPDPDKPVHHTIHRLLMAIPGCPQGPRLWNKKLHKELTALHLVQCKHEFPLYATTDKKIFILVWVDDIFMFFPTLLTAEAAALWKAVQKIVDLDDWENIHDALGCIVTRDRMNRKISLSQKPAADKVIEKLGLSACNSVDTPLKSDTKLTKEDCPKPADFTDTAAQKWYRSAIASMIYFMLWTRPDIVYSVSKLCRFMHNPGTSHEAALKRLLRFFANTTGYGLQFDFSSDPEKAGVYAYYDASHADCPDTMKSTLAYIFFFEGCPISWNTKLHTYITTSTNHSVLRCMLQKPQRRPSG